MLNFPYKSNHFISICVKYYKSTPMIKNFISFNNLVAKINECRKKMTIMRHEILLQEESGHDTEHQKRELFNLSNEINQLQSALRNFQRKARIFIYWLGFFVVNWEF